MNDFSSFHVSVHKNDDINSIFLSRENYFCTLYLQFERLLYIRILRFSKNIIRYYSRLRNSGILFVASPPLSRIPLSLRSEAINHRNPFGSSRRGTRRRNFGPRTFVEKPVISYLSSFENTFVKTHKTRETAT